MKEYQHYKVELTGWRDNAHTKPHIKIESNITQLLTADNVDNSGFRDLNLVFRPLTNLLGLTAEEKEHDYKITVYGKNIIA